jgi:hypothetical protein
VVRGIIKILGFIFLWMGLSQPCLYSQNFRAQVSANRVALNQNFQVDFTVEGSGSNFIPPSFRDFNVLNGPSTSSSIQVINGQMSQSLTYSYILMPQKTGTFVIPSAFITINGTKLKTNPISIEVVNGAQSGQNNPRQQQQNNNNQQNAPQNAKDDLLVRVSVNNTHPCEGEQIVATFKVYTRLAISGYSISQTPKLTGFWLQDVQLPQNPVVGKETFNGKQYNVATIYKVVLFPQKSGELTIDPLELDANVQVQVKQRGRGFFDDFFNDPFFGNAMGVQNVKMKVKSNPVKINVKPLPAGKPAEFDNMTGDFTMEVKPDKTTTKTNEPVTLKISIKGKGNIKLISPFKLDLPEDIETYEPKAKESISNTGDVISGSKTFEYLLIPRREGIYKIPEVTFCYFDPVKGKYNTLRSGDINITVQKGTGRAYADLPSSTDQKSIEYRGKDILFIKLEHPQFSKKGFWFVGSSLFYVLLGIPVILLLIMLLFKQKINEMQNNVTLIKMKKANALARKKLKAAKKHLAAKQKEEFYMSITNAFYSYISNKLTMEITDLSKDNIRIELAARQVGEEHINRLMELLDNCDFVRYAPSMAAYDMGKFYHDAVELLTAIEKEIK